MTIIRKQIDRREILRWAAMATASVTAAAACGTGTGGTPDVITMGDSAPPTDAATDTPGDVVVASDVMTLNALRGAELRAIGAYTAGAGILMAPSMTDPMAASASVYLSVAARFMAQHRDHAAALGAMVTAMGGTPVPEGSVTFTPPMGFTPTVTNVLRLAANEEKGAAVAYVQTQMALNSASSRFLAGAISGDETQHFIVLYVLLKGLAAPTAMIASMVDQIVPTSFVSNLDGAMNGLQSQADFTYG